MLMKKKCKNGWALPRPRPPPGTLLLNFGVRMGTGVPGIDRRKDTGTTQRPFSGARFRNGQCSPLRQPDFRNQLPSTGWLVCGTAATPERTGGEVGFPISYTAEAAVLHDEP